MNILIYSSTYDLSGSSIRATMLARGLKENGQTVAIAGYTIPEYLHTMFKTYIFPHQSNGKDQLLRSAIEFQPEWIIGITEDSAEWVSQIAKALDCKSAIDLHAISIFEIIDLGKGYGNRINRIRKSLMYMKKMLNCNFIITCTPNLYKLVRLIKGRSNTFDLTGLVDIEAYSGIETIRSNNKVNILYVGNYYRWQGVDLYLDAAEIVDRLSNKFSFKILGSVGLANYSKIFDHSMIKNGPVVVEGPVPHHLVSKYLNSTDILIIPRPRMLSTHFGFPSKLCEYMAAGKIIIATNLSPHRWALENPRCGILCPPNARGIANAILNVNLDQAEDYAQTARRIAKEKFDYIKQCGKLVSELQKRINN